jgi:hypothetical protein
MTLEQLKSLKVGDVVRYTNKEDASHSYDAEVSYIDRGLVEIVPQNGDAYVIIEWADPDIQHIASTLAFVPPTNSNELQIILHQIKDAEFDYTSGICSNAEGLLNLTKLRKKRDNLLKQNI